MKKIIGAVSLILLGFAALLSQTPQYPVTVATDSQLKVAGNRVQTRLLASMGSGDTAVVVLSGTGFAANMLVAIGSEIISICGVSGNVLSVGASTASCPNVNGRGYDGTSAAAHAAAPCTATNTSGCVSNYIASWYHNASRVEIEATQKWGGVPIANLKAFGAVCDGSDVNTAVQAAVAAGAKAVMLPAGCTWIAPGTITNANLAVYGEDWLTSVIKCGANPNLCGLYVGAKSALYNVNVQALTSCVDPLSGLANCPERRITNMDVNPALVIATPFMTDDIQNNSTADYAAWQCRIPSGGTGDCIYTETLAGSNATAIRSYNSSTSGAAGLFGRMNTGPGLQVNDIGPLALSGSLFSEFTTFKTSGEMVNLTQRTSHYSGTAFALNMADVSGTFDGYFGVYSNAGVVKHSVDYAGNSVQTGTITASIATGTAPLVITSTTPVANLTGQIRSYIAGTQQTNAFEQHGTCVLGTNCAVTLSPVYSNTAYACNANDQTAAAAVKVVNTSASVVTFTGTGTDTIAFSCVGK